MDLEGFAPSPPIRLTYYVINYNLLLSKDNNDSLDGSTEVNPNSSPYQAKYSLI